MMKKKVILIMSIVVLLLLVVGGTVFFLKQQSSLTTAPIGENQPSPTPSVTLVEWVDPAGFTFQYPKGIDINKHDEDQEHYAHLEFSSPEHTGTMFVWAKDTSYDTMDAWLKADKTLNSAANVDTKLGTIEGKKIIQETGGVKKMITGVITDAILFTVEMEKGTDPFWDETYDTVVKSFAFEGESKTQQSTSPSYSDEEVSVDEEETLE